MKNVIFIFSLMVLVTKAARHYLLDLVGEEKCARYIINYVQENTEINLGEFLRLTPKTPFRDLLELEYRRLKLALNPKRIFPLYRGTKINLLLFIINKLRKRLNDETLSQSYDINLSQFIYFDQYIQFCYNLALFHINNSPEYSNRIYKRTVTNYLKRTLNLNRMAIIMSLERYAQQFQSIVLVFLSDGALLPNYSLNIPEFSQSTKDNKLLPSHIKNLRTRKKLVFFIHKVINLLILCLIKTCCTFNRIVSKREEEEKRVIEEQATNLACLAESELEKFSFKVSQSIQFEYSCLCEVGEFVILINSEFISIDQIDIFTITFPIDASAVTCSIKNKKDEVGWSGKNKYIFSIYLNKPNDYRKIVDLLIANDEILEYRKELEQFIEVNL